MDEGIEEGEGRRTKKKRWNKQRNNFRGRT